MVTELFAPVIEPPTDHHWERTILECARTIAQGGLGEEARSPLLGKYETKSDLASLGAPKLNSFLGPSLKSSASTLKRDGFQAQAQAQVGAALNALGKGISAIMKPEILSWLPEEAKGGLSQLADGIRLLADHQHGLSMARWAFISPAFNLLGKTAADSAPVDEFLFGKEFVEALKQAQSAEKAARELLQPPKPKQPQQPQQQKQQPKHQPKQQPARFEAAKQQKNSKPPVRPRSGAGGTFRQKNNKRSSSRRR